MRAIDSCSIYFALPVCGAPSSGPPRGVGGGKKEETMTIQSETFRQGASDCLRCFLSCSALGLLRGEMDVVRS